MSELLLALCAGAVGGVLVQLVLQVKGERARFQAAIEPVRADLDSLADSFDSWRKGYDRRLKNAPRSAESDDPEELDTSVPPTTGLERARRVERIRRDM